ncbi:MAG TPA: hypothetical protein VLC46_20430 [Thermoanaerobaculia bacterium]|jgi:hypothetical protein|nr:hypothetical protein [Thermoanaerobaculia bacterium]
MTTCIRCLAGVDLEEFLRNDHVCDVCAELTPAETYKYRSNTTEQTAAIAAMEA